MDAEALCVCTQTIISVGRKIQAKLNPDMYLALVYMPKKQNKLNLVPWVFDACAYTK